MQTETKTHRSYSQFISIKKGVLKIYRDGGSLSFFKGNGLNVLKIMPESALKFYVFEHAKEYLAMRRGGGKSEEDLGWKRRLVAGGIAGLISQFAIYPIETIKTRLMAQIGSSSSSSSDHHHHHHHHRSIPSVIRNLVREGGIRAFYRGCGPALVGIVPYAGVDLAVFETLKNTYRDMQEKGPVEKIPISVILACGMISGTCGAVLMYPLGLVRTRYPSTHTQHLTLGCKLREHHLILHIIPLHLM